MSEDQRQEYWEKSLPFTIYDKPTPYQEKRAMRYGLEDIPALMEFKRFEGKSVLEIGSGSGIDAAEIAKYASKITCVDFTEAGVRNTTNTLKEAGVTNYDVRLASIERRLPFDDETFDAVYSFGVLHHIPRHDLALKEIVRVLKPGGEFVGMVYNKNSLLFAYLLLRYRHTGLSTVDIASKYSERNVGCPYTNPYTEDEIRVVFEDFFTKVETKIEYPVIDTAEQRKVKLEGMPKYLGWHIMFRATK